MKKFLAILLTLCMILSLCACASTSKAPETTETTVVTEAATEAPTEEVTEAPTEEVTEAPTEEVTEAPTEAATEAPTEEVTEAEPAAQAETEEATEEVTEAPTEEATEEVTEEATEETAEAAKIPVKVFNNSNAVIEVFDYVEGDAASLETPCEAVTVGNQLAVKVTPAEGYKVAHLRVNSKSIDDTYADGYWFAPATEDINSFAVKALMVKEEATEETEAVEETVVEETASVAPMTHEEYVAAELDSPVCVETYVQAHQSWWDGKITVYAQSEDGAYFLYNMACSEEDAAKLVPGTKILVNGFKSEWSGEVEIVDATFEILEGSYIAEPCDVTELLGVPELVDHQNEFVTVKGLTVESIAFKNDEPGDDIYVTLTQGELTAEFCVEAYLTGPDTDVYAAVSALNKGDVVDIEGFLYWYNGANTHITGITVVTPAAVEETEAAVEETEAVVEETAAVPGVITKVALVTDVGTIDDESFNQACWQGVEEWCKQNDIEYTYYQPTEDSTDARVLSVFQAANDGANVIVMPGYLFGTTVLTVQDELPDVYFIAVDVAAGDLTFDYSTYYDPSANVACLTFSEEQAGYLAGYAAVKEGYTKLGFLGGMAVPAVIRYGYGFVQGADAAAAETGAEVEINYTYGGQFYGSPEITAKMEGWYQNGTEVVFACGGGIYTSALEAAEKNGGKVIGVDVDQSYISPLIITSAMKGLQNVTESLLESLNKGEWETYGGKVTNFGLLEGEYVGLPTATWSLQNVSVEDYEAVKEQIKSGEIVVDNSTEAMPEVSITVNEIA
ncbi:MAG: BMP family ABC transporter substrate-binding protein [Candidatus Faecousia sp.]|nr:BMP family ABC transporter substrate-binding protein [Candidatus Faecousia sp.]